LDLYLELVFYLPRYNSGSVNVKEKYLKHALAILMEGFLAGIPLPYLWDAFAISFPYSLHTYVILTSYLPHTYFILTSYLPHTLLI
jgi:hypothetical protein